MIPLLGIQKEWFMKWSLLANLDSRNRRILMGYFHCSTDVLFDFTIAYGVLKSPRKVFQHVSRWETDGTFFLHVNPNSIEATHPAYIYIYILKQYNIYTSSHETTFCQLLVPFKKIFRFHPIDELFASFQHFPTTRWSLCSLGIPENEIDSHLCAFEGKPYLEVTGS